MHTDSYLRSFHFMSLSLLSLLLSFQNVRALCVTSNCTLPLVECSTCQAEATSTYAKDSLVHSYFCDSFTGSCALNTSTVQLYSYDNCEGVTTCCSPFFYTAFADNGGISKYYNDTPTMVLSQRQGCESKSCVPITPISLGYSNAWIMVAGECSGNTLITAVLDTVSMPMPHTTVNAGNVTAKYDSMANQCNLTFYSYNVSSTDDQTSGVTLLELYAEITLLQHIYGGETNMSSNIPQTALQGLGCSPLGECLADPSIPPTFIDCCNTATQCSDAGYTTNNPCATVGCSNRNCVAVPIEFCCAPMQDDSVCVTSPYVDPSSDPQQIVCAPSDDPTEQGYRCQSIYTNDSMTMCQTDQDCGGLQLCANITCDLSTMSCVSKPRPFPATQLCCVDSTVAGTAECQVRVCETLVGCNYQGRIVGSRNLVALPDFTCQYTTQFNEGCCGTDADCVALSANSPCVIGQTDIGTVINGACPIAGGNCLLASTNPSDTPGISGQPCCYNDDQCGEQPPPDACQSILCTGGTGSSDAFTCELYTPNQTDCGPTAVNYPMSGVSANIINGSCNYDCSQPANVTANPINTLFLHQELLNFGPFPAYGLDISITVNNNAPTEHTISSVEMHVDQSTTLLKGGRPLIAPSTFQPDVPVNANDSAGSFTEQFDMNLNESRKFLPGETWAFDFKVAFVGDPAVTSYTIFATFMPYDLCSSYYEGYYPNCLTSADIASRNKIYRTPVTAPESVYYFGASPPTGLPGGADTHSCTQCYNETGVLPVYGSYEDRDDDDYLDNYITNYHENSQSVTDSEFSGHAGIVYAPYPTPPPTPPPTPASLAPTPGPTAKGGKTNSPTPVPGSPSSPRPVPIVLRIGGGGNGGSSSDTASSISSEESDGEIVLEGRKRSMVIINIGPAVPTGYVGGIVFFDGNGDGEDTGVSGDDSNLGGVRVYAIDTATGVTLTSTTSAASSGLFLFNTESLFALVSDQSQGAFFRINAPPFGTNITQLGNVSVLIDNAFYPENTIYLSQPAPATAVVSPSFTNSSIYVQYNAGFVQYFAPPCVPNTTLPSGANDSVIIEAVDQSCSVCPLNISGSGGGLKYGSCTASLCGSSGTVQRRIEVEFAISNFNTTVVNGSLAQPGSVLTVEFQQLDSTLANASVLCVDAHAIPPLISSPNNVTAVDQGRSISAGSNKRLAFVTYTWPSLPYGSDVVRFRVQFNFCATSSLFAYNVTASIESNLCYRLIQNWLNCTEPTPDFQQCLAVAEGTSSTGVCSTCAPSPAPTPFSNSSSSGSHRHSDSSGSSSDNGDYADYDDDDSVEQHVREDDRLQIGTGSNTSLVVSGGFTRESGSCLNSTVFKRLHCDDVGVAAVVCGQSTSNSGVLRATVNLSTLAGASSSNRLESGTLIVVLTRSMSESSGEVCRSFDPTLTLEVIQGSTRLPHKALVFENTLHRRENEQRATLRIMFDRFRNSTQLTLVLSVLECLGAASSATSALNYTLSARLATSRCFDHIACTRVWRSPNTLAAVPLTSGCTSADHRPVFVRRTGPGLHVHDVYYRSLTPHNAERGNLFLLLWIVVGIAACCFVVVIVCTLARSGSRTTVGTRQRRTPE